MDERILTNYYSLAVHPFEPPVDPATKFDFKAKSVSLLREFDVFHHHALRACFIEVGPFAQAAENIREYLEARSYDPTLGDPPMLMIQGARGTGIDTMARYVAYLVKQAAKDAPLLLDSVPVKTDSQAKFLMLLEQKIEHHVKAIAGAATIFQKFEKLIDPKAPDKGYLEALLNDLKEPLASGPGLILIIGPISWDLREWIPWLFGLLNPLNVLGILLTEDPRVAGKFDELAKSNTIQGVSARLRGLTATEGKEFAERRLAYFRRKPYGATLFPYAPAALAKMFDVPDGALVVKLFIQVLRGSINRKVIKLSPTFTDPPPPTSETEITWNDIADSYAAVVKRR